MWKVLCSSFLQKYVKYNDTVIDIGAGYCEFINNINCAKKIAIDLNPDTKKFANKEVEVVSCSALKIPQKYKGSADVLFMSNFLEHLSSKQEVIDCLANANQLLKNVGRIILIQPNINLVKEKYWDFIDHTVPLNKGSIEEALAITGFQKGETVEKFLPYNTKINLPMPNILLKFYLTLPSIIRPFAGQSFFMATKSKHG